MEDFFFLKAKNPMWPASANVFAIKDADGLILMDVGCGLKKFTRYLYKKMEESNLNIKDLHTVVISHAHPDHMGAMDSIYKEINDQKASDLQILINAIERESALNINLLNDSFDVELLKKYFKSGLEERFKGKFDVNQNFKVLCKMSELPEDANIHIIKDGDVLKLGRYRFRVYITPGHAPGHTSFFEINQKFLLSGDLIGEKGTTWYSPSSGGAIGYLSSLKKLEKLSIDLIYPSHGNKFHHVQERINEIRTKILAKDDIILEMLDKNPQTVMNLVKLFYSSSYTQMFPGIAIIESHLIKLEKEKKIERDNKLIRKI